MNQLLDDNRARVKSLFPTGAVTLQNWLASKLLLCDEDERASFGFRLVAIRKAPFQ
jgi:hypothetical protein